MRSSPASSKLYNSDKSTIQQRSSWISKGTISWDCIRDFHRCQTCRLNRLIQDDLQLQGAPRSWTTLSGESSASVWMPSDPCYLASDTPRVVNCSCWWKGYCHAAWVQYWSVTLCNQFGAKQIIHILVKQQFNLGITESQRKCCTSRCCHKLHHGAAAAIPGLLQRVAGWHGCWLSHGLGLRHWRTPTPSLPHCALGWRRAAHWWQASRCERWRRRFHWQDRWIGQCGCHTFHPGCCEVGQIQSAGPSCLGQNWLCEKQWRPLAAAGREGRTAWEAGQCGGGRGEWVALPWWRLRRNPHDQSPRQPRPPPGPGCWPGMSHSKLLHNQDNNKNLQWVSTTL